MLRNLIRSSVNIVPWSLRRSIKDLPIIARAQRWFFDTTLAGQSFVHVINAGPAKGLVYPVSLPQDKAIWAGTYEPRFALALASAVRRGDVCYDIGGFRGFMGGVCARAGASLVVIFEPFPANCEQIRRMAALNPGLPFRLEPTAVGDRDGNVEFRIMPEESMGKLTESPFQPGAAGAGFMTVPVRRLDSLVRDGHLPPPNVIKVDVEGTELLVLRGAIQVLRQHGPRLLIEAHSPELARDCKAFLQALRYQTSWLQGSTDRASGDGAGVCHLLAEPAAADG
jgi:FkbM family methyltransferase